MAVNVNMKRKNQTRKEEGELDENTGIKPVPFRPTAAPVVCWIVQSSREHDFIVIGWGTSKGNYENSPELNIDMHRAGRAD